MTGNRTSDLDGGGIYNDRGDVDLNDGSSVSGNTSARRRRHLQPRMASAPAIPPPILGGSSSVTFDTAARTGGGVFNHLAAFNT